MEEIFEDSITKCYLSRSRKNLGSSRGHVKWLGEARKNLHGFFYAVWSLVVLFTAFVHVGSVGRFFIVVSLKFAGGMLSDFCTQILWSHMSTFSFGMRIWMWSILMLRSMFV
jgi:hypothetical protein